MAEENIYEAIDYLNNAKTNIGNIRRIGTALLPMVEEQIDSALGVLQKIADAPPEPEAKCSNCNNPLYAGHFSIFRLCHKDECMRQVSDELRESE